MAHLRFGALDEIAQMINATNDTDLMNFLGVDQKGLEDIRYGRSISLAKADDIVRRREAHLRAAELLDPKTAA